MDRFLSYGKQVIEEDDIAAVVSALKSDYLTQGPLIKEFERRICDYTGAEYCVALANGTAALHIAVAALEMDCTKPVNGITSPITFAATSNAMIYNHITPRFADIHHATYNIDPEAMRKVADEETGLLIPVHFAGQPADMVEIKEYADEKQLSVIEDAAHAIGSAYENGKMVGCCCYSDMTIFSFHPVKTITTAEGGAVTTNCEKLYQRLLLLRTHGITKDPALLATNEGPWYYEMQTLGFNYRITDLQAALGISQLNKLERFKAERQRIIKNYNEAFAGVDWLKTPYADDNRDLCMHLYVLQIDFKKINSTRTEVMNKLHQDGIGTQVHYIPLYSQPFYQKEYSYSRDHFPEAELYYSRALSIPLFAGLTESEQEYIIKKIISLGE